MPIRDDLASVLRSLNRTGYSLAVMPDRRNILLDALQSHESVSEAVPEFSHGRSVPMLCFLSFEDGYVTHLATGTRGRPAATQMRRLNLENVVELNDHIEHFDILERIESRYKKRIRNKLENGGVLAPAAFNQLVEAVWLLSPGAQSFLSRYRQSRLFEIANLPRRTRQALAHQKDAVSTALRIAGIETDELQAWTSSAGQTSFLSGLRHVRVREDAVVAADLNQIPGFDVVQRYQYSAVTFENEYTRLTVVLANHLPLEEQVGADLVYYNHRYDSFVAVQYKMMEAGGSDGPCFRMPNAQLELEVARMRNIMATLNRAPAAGVPQAFRLTDNPFFLKFCSRDLFDPDDESLVKGMYFPLDLWRFIGADETLVGSRGGRQINYRNVGRYFDNTEFMTLVTHSWVGTTPGQSAILSPIIQEVLEGGRAVILADAAPGSVTSAPPPHSRRR